MKEKERETITNIPTVLQGYNLDKHGIIFDRDVFIRKWHDEEEKALLKIIGLSAFLQLLIIIIS